MYAFSENIEEYEIRNVLGKGGFATVYRGKCTGNNHEVAIKMIDKKLMQAYNMTDRVRQEVAIHSRLKHPSILELYTFFEDTNYVYLILELAQNGELYSFMKANRKYMNEFEAANVMQQVIAGVLYLHSHQILHRDISLSNLLLSKDMKVKIADFGLATQLNELGENHRTLCGTPNYISPEVASRSNHGLPADVWSLGCMLYTLLVGRPPFDTNSVKSTLTQVVMGSFTIPENLSMDACDLIKSMLHKDPSKRICLEEVVSHPFMVKFSKKQQYTMATNDSGIATMSGISQQPFKYHRSRSEERKQELNLKTFGGNSLHQKFSHLEVQDGRVLHGSIKENLHEIHQYQYQQYEHGKVSSTFYDHRSKEEYYGAAPLIASKSDGFCLTDSPHYGSSNNARIPERRVLEPLRATPLTRENENGNGMVPMTPKFHQYSPSPTQSPSPIPVEAKLTVPPLTTERLQPTRHKTKNAVLSILESGEVVIEFIKYKSRYNEERVNDVCRISSDGLRIVLYQPNNGKGVPVRNTPIEIPETGADHIFSYENLPAKHWKKYLYAFRFIQMVKAKTPKVTFYSEQAKCQLMENLDDFEANFYSGIKITKNSGDGCRMFEESGTEVNLKQVRLENSVSAKLQHVEMVFQHCCNVEASMSAIGMSSRFPCFPLIIGRRPAAKINVLPQPNLSNTNKDNTFNNYLSSAQTPVRAPNIQMPSFSYDNFAGSPLPIHHPNSQKGVTGFASTEFTKKIFIPHVGHAVHFTNGIVQIQYLDNTQITVLSVLQGGGILYSPAGSQHKQPIHYNENDLMPDPVKHKFKQIPNVLKQLMASSEMNNVLVTSTPATNRLNHMKYIR